MNIKKIVASVPINRSEAETEAAKTTTLKKKLKAWATLAVQCLFLALFLCLLAAILYAAQLLRR